MSFYICSMLPNGCLSKKACSCLWDIMAIKRNTHIIINALSHHIA